MRQPASTAPGTNATSTFPCYGYRTVRTVFLGSTTKAFFANNSSSSSSSSSSSNANNANNNNNNNKNDKRAFAASIDRTMKYFPHTVTAPVIFAMALTLAVFEFRGCHAFHHETPLLSLRSSSQQRQQQQQQQQQRRRRRQLQPGNGVLLSEHTLSEEFFESPGDDGFLDEDGPKAELLREIATGGPGDGSPRFGFGDAEPSKTKIAGLVDDLSGYVLPLARPSRWKLLYNTAPDVLGFGGGPLSRLVSIRQSVGGGLDDADRLDLELEYRPSDNIVRLAGSFLDNLGEDRLVQTVEFDYKVGAMNKVDLQLKGTSIEASRLSSLAALPPLRSPSPLPFVGFSVVFNDGDLRVDRTVQGDFLYIYRRIK
eukprot:jgi/Psemu1/26807/gm1.26807_g